MPSVPRPSFIVFTPSTRPRRSSSGPPLLPGLMAASVWTMLTLSNERTPLTMPRVTVLASPRGEPIATTSDPIVTSFRPASGSPAWSRSAMCSFRTARSMSCDTFTTRAVRE